MLPCRIRNMVTITIITSSFIIISKERKGGDYLAGQEKEAGDSHRVLANLRQGGEQPGNMQIQYLTQIQIQTKYK